jgi:hypothetical protein
MNSIFYFWGIVWQQINWNVICLCIPIEARVSQLTLVSYLPIWRQEANVYPSIGIMYGQLINTLAFLDWLCYVYIMILS